MPASPNYPNGYMDNQKFYDGDDKPVPLSFFGPSPKALMAEVHIRAFHYYPNIESQLKLMIGSAYKNNHSAYYPQYQFL